MKALVLALASSLVTSVAFGQGDDCAGAELLADTEDYCSAEEAFTTAGLTFSGRASTCTAGNGAPDGWFRFTATRAGVAIKTTSVGTSLSDVNLTLYTGDCGGLREVRCSPDRGLSALTSIVSTELVVGRTYFLRVYGGRNAEDDGWTAGTFNLCVRSFVPGPPAATDCAVAERICGPPRDFTLPIFTDAGRFDDLSATCLGAAGGSESQSLWYKFTAANDGLLELVFTSEDPATDIDFIVFSLPTGSTACGARVVERCNVAGGAGCTGVTGMRDGDPDEVETSGCNQASTPDQDTRNDTNDGFVDALRLEAGRSYLLFINNRLLYNGSLWFSRLYNGSCFCWR